MCVNLKFRILEGNASIFKKIGIASISFLPKLILNVSNNFNSEIPYFKCFKEALEKDFSPNFK